MAPLREQHIGIEDLRTGEQMHAAQIEMRGACDNGKHVVTANKALLGAGTQSLVKLDKALANLPQLKALFSNTNLTDVNNDGLPDIWHTAIENETFPLYLNAGKGQFTEVTGPGGVYGNNAGDDRLWAVGWDTRSVILRLLQKLIIALTTGNLRKHLSLRFDSLKCILNKCWIDYFLIYDEHSSCYFSSINDDGSIGGR